MGITTTSELQCRKHKVSLTRTFLSRHCSVSVLWKSAWFWKCAKSAKILKWYHCLKQNKHLLFLNNWIKSKMHNILDCEAIDVEKLRLDTTLQQDSKQEADPSFLLNIMTVQLTSSGGQHPFKKSLCQRCLQVATKSKNSHSVSPHE